MHWQYKEVEELSLSTFNNIINYLSLHPPLELLVSSYLGYNWGQDTNKAKNEEKKAFAEELRHVDFSKLSSSVIIYDETLLERAKNLYKDLE